MSIYGMLTGFIGYNVHNHWVTALKTNKVVIILEAVAGTSRAYLSIKAANTLFIDVCNHLPPRLPKIQDQKLLLIF
jgi:hypothetical protein